MVTFIDTDAERKPPAGDCFAVMVAVPVRSATMVKPSRPTIVGSELVSVHAPVEFDLGIVNCTLETESIERVISLKDPIVGAGALIVKVIVFVAVVHL
jgi:hypothetical protein